MKRILFGVITIVLVGGGWYWMYGPCGVRPVAEGRERLRSLADRWSDAVQVASATPMIALAGPLGRLQDLRRETKELRVPGCTEHARNLLAKNMEITLEALLAVMSAPPGQRDALQGAVSERMRDASQKLTDFQAEMSRLSSCPPICDGVLATALGRD